MSTTRRKRTTSCLINQTLSRPQKRKIRSRDEFNNDPEVKELRKCMEKLKQLEQEEHVMKERHQRERMAIQTKAQSMNMAMRCVGTDVLEDVVADDDEYERIDVKFDVKDCVVLDGYDKVKMQVFGTPEVDDYVLDTREFRNRERDLTRMLSDSDDVIIDGIDDDIYESKYSVSPPTHESNVATPTKNGYVQYSPLTSALFKNLKDFERSYQ